MNEITTRHVEDFARSLPSGSSINVEALGNLVLIEQRDGSHILKATRAHKDNGETITDAVADCVEILRFHGHDATTPRQRYDRSMKAAEAAILTEIA